MALIVDYILTMGISVARNADGAFSPLPLPVAAWSFKSSTALALASGIVHILDRRCNNFNFGASRSIFWLTQTDPPPIGAHLRRPAQAVTAFPFRLK